MNKEHYYQFLIGNDNVLVILDNHTIKNSGKDIEIINNITDKYYNNKLSSLEIKRYYKDGYLIVPTNRMCIINKGQSSLRNTNKIELFNSSYQ